MFMPSPAPVSPAPLEQTVEQQIRRRTWGRVCALQVERKGDSMVVRGSTPSYYVKQLAISAALDALGQRSSPRLEVDIDVGPSRQDAGHAYHFSRP